MKEFLSEDNGYKIGIDLGGSHIGIVITDSYGNILNKKSKDIDLSYIENSNEKQKQIIDTIVSLIKCCANEIKIDTNRINFIGIGVPGLHKDTTIKHLTNIEVKDFDIGKLLKERYEDLGLDSQIAKIQVENDGNCATIGESIVGSLKDVTNRN